MFFPPSPLIFRSNFLFSSFRIYVHSEPTTSTTTNRELQAIVSTHSDPFFWIDQVFYCRALFRFRTCYYQLVQGWGSYIFTLNQLLYHSQTVRCSIPPYSSMLPIRVAILTETHPELSPVYSAWAARTRLNVTSEKLTLCRLQVKNYDSCWPLK